MIPFNLLFRPPAVLRNHPVRDWRDITLWLKWGLIITILSVFLRAVLAEDPATISWIFSLFEWLNNYHDTIQLPIPLQFALFFVIESLIAVLLWLLKGVLLLIGYQLFEDIYFDETNIAFSIAGASMVTNVWLIMPWGTVVAVLHAFVLVSVLTSEVHRISLFKGGLFGIIALLPMVF